MVFGSYPESQWVLLRATLGIFMFEAACSSSTMTFTTARFLDGWKIMKKSMENLWKIYGTSWEICGNSSKSMENHGKSWENHGKISLHPPCLQKLCIHQIMGTWHGLAEKWSLVWLRGLYNDYMRIVHGNYIWHFGTIIHIIHIFII